jgi:hypothetical protein
MYSSNGIYITKLPYTELFSSPHSVTSEILYPKDIVPKCLADSAFLHINTSIHPDTGISLQASHLHKTGEFVVFCHGGLPACQISQCPCQGSYCGWKYNIISSPVYDVHAPGKIRATKCKFC